MRRPDNPLFSSDLWERALESFGSATHLTVKLFDAHADVVFGPVHVTPLVQLFQDTTGYDPGLFTDCARRCLKQSDSRPPVILPEFWGLAVVGASLMLDSEIVGAAVAGYALLDFCQVSEVQRLAQDSGIAFEQLWRVAREQKPVPQQRLFVNGELLQLLGEALLRENSRTRQYGTALRSSETQLRALTARLITTQEEERRRLARDLHDDTLQRVVSVANQVALLRAKLPENMRYAGEQLEDIERQMERASQELRSLSHSLHPSILDDLGLETATRQLVADFAERTSQKARFHCENLPGTISPNVSTTLYRIAQAALSNARKHAPQAAVTVTLFGLPGKLGLTVEDDGPGFDQERRSLEPGLGLISMEERAHGAGGNFTVKSRPGEGVRIEVVVPLRES